MRKTYITLAWVVFGLAFNLHAQTASFGGVIGVATPIQSSSSDSIVAVTADAYGLSLVAPADLPRYGTYWVVLPYGGMVPMPCQPMDMTLPIYAITDNIFLVDSTGGQIAASPRPTATLSRSTQSLSAAVNTQGNAIANLIEQVQDAQMMRDTAMMFGMDVPSFGDGGGDGGGYTNSYIGFTIDTNLLWLEITNVANGVSYLNLHHATNQVYAIWTTTDLLQPFTVETELWPTNGDCQPFVLANYDRQNLFVRAMDWTGVTHGGNTTPDWWLWNYFGTTSLSDTNLDSQGNTLGYDYAHGLDPNVIQFTIEAANQYVHSPTVSAQLNIAAGSPCYYAVLVNGQTTTNWQPFTTTNLSVYLGATDGVYNVSIGLRGLPVNAQQTWDSYSFTLDRVAPKISLTNPAGGLVVKPYLQLQGYADKPLASLSYDISNGAGSATNQDAFVTDQSFDPNKFDFTTNYFQAYDVPLATNANYITLRVTDRAGNTTTTNFNVVLDYSGATNPPTVNLIWPQDGMAIGGTAFTLRGTMGDETGNVTAQIVDEAGNTNTVAGLVERNGMFWVENLPLTTNGDNTITITATDAAGNVTTTNLTVTASDVTLTIDHTPTGAALYQGYGSVSGTISDASYSVVVNGVTVTNDYWTDGVTWYWEADNVPIYGQGTATFDAVANPPEQSSFSQSRFQAQTSTPTPLPSWVSATKEMGAYVAMVSYNCTEIQNYYYNGEYSYSYGVKKTLTANPAVTPDGKWIMNDIRSSDIDDWGFDHYYYRWSQAGSIPATEEYDDMYGGSYNGPAIWPSYPSYPGWLASEWQAFPHEDAKVPGVTGSQAPTYIHHYYAQGLPTYYNKVGSTIAQDVSVTAVSQVKLFTGGKAQVSRINLFQIQANASEILPPPLDHPELGLWWNVPTKTIAAKNLKVGNKQLGNDGNLWLGLPDNSTTDLTVTAPNKHHYDANATATKYKLNIVANGNDLSVTNPEFCVGQKVTFTLANLPTGNVIVNSRGSWQLPAKFVNQQTNYSPTCTNYVQNNNLLQNTNQTSCWFVNIPNGQGHVSVGLNLLFNNGQSAGIAANGDFAVFRPQLVATNMNENFLNPNVNIPNPPLYATNVNGALKLGDSQGGYARFWAQYKSAYAGTFREAQIVQAYGKAGNDNPVDSGSQWWGDGAGNKAGSASVVSSSPGVAWVMQTDISPSVPLIAPQTVVNQVFKTYFQFNPNPNGDGIWVTVGRVNWSWAATSTYTNGQWNPPSGTTVSNPQYYDDDRFPLFEDITANHLNY